MGWDGVMGEGIRTYKVKEVLVVDKVLLGKQTAEGRETQGMSFIRAKLKHSNSIRGREVQCARDLDINHQYHDPAYFNPHSMIDSPEN